MSLPSPVIAQSLDYFGQGIYLLIGILVGLLFLGTVGLAAFVGLRVWLFHLRQQQAREVYLKRTRRADGKSYPPQGVGVCEQCGRVRKIVYFVRTGEKLCRECYEAWWPIAEGTKVSTSPPSSRLQQDEPRLADRHRQHAGVPLNPEP